MKILVACEESQRVTLAFRNKGHSAFSCDIKPCSGGFPQYHIQDDVINHLDGWDMIIAHPPCTYLTSASATSLFKGREVDKGYKLVNLERLELGISAMMFFYKIYNADCEKICIENPTPIKIFNLPEYSQIIQPYEFGEPYYKRTCLWLKGLPKLKPTNIVEPLESWVFSENTNHDRSTMRAKTFQGIANAMSDQWG